MKVLIPIVIGLLVVGCSSTDMPKTGEKAPNDKPFLTITKETKVVRVGSPFILEVELRAQRITSNSGTVPLPRLRTEGVRYNNKNRFKIKHSTLPANGKIWHVFSYRTELVALNKGTREIEFNIDFETIDFSKNLFGKKITHSLTNKISIDVCP